ncbi:MAG: hypothetical protein K0Q94_6033, partial [Paenibacillus sp.]|nr:hypothetical protein [Paenibacillus sp.]
YSAKGRPISFRIEAVDGSGVSYLLQMRTPKPLCPKGFRCLKCITYDCMITRPQAQALLTNRGHQKASLGKI